MLIDTSFNFREEICASAQPMEGGQLSFLPLAQHYALGEAMKALYTELDECLLLELKGSVGRSGFRVDLSGEGIAFWQLYQFMGPAELYLPQSLPLGENRCISFSGKEKQVPLLLGEGKQWLVLIGYREEAAACLLKEFPMMSSLVYGEGDPGKLFFFEPDIGINHSLREIWRRISQSDYAPFRGKAALLLDICRLLEIYCRELDRQSDQSERTRLALYHKALAYINDNIYDSVNKEMLLKALQVNARTLERAFENRPIKIAEYIQQTKLDKARTLLREGEMSVDQIANLLNFPNRKYFSREFKKYFFQSPSAFLKDMETYRRKR